MRTEDAEQHMNLHKLNNIINLFMFFRENFLPPPPPQIPLRYQLFKLGHGLWSIKLMKNNTGRNYKSIQSNSITEK